MTTLCTEQGGQSASNLRQSLQHRLVEPQVKYGSAGTSVLKSFLVGLPSLGLAAPTVLLDGTPHQGSAVRRKRAGDEDALPGKPRLCSAPTDR